MHNEIDSIFEIIEEIKAFLPRLHKASDSVSELFYDQMNPESWEVFSQVVAGIDDLYQTLNAASNGLLDYGVDYGLQNILKQAASAIEIRFAQLNIQLDLNRHLAVGDIIRYEFMPLIEELYNDLGEEGDAMEARFASNLQIMSAAHPKIGQRLATLKRDMAHYQLVRAKNGAANLHIKQQSGGSAFLYSEYNPDYEVGRWVETVLGKVEGNQHIIVYGFGLGHHLLELSKHMKDVKYYVVEPDEQVLLAAMLTLDLQAFFESVKIERIVLGQEKNIIEEIMKDFFAVNGSKVTNIEIPLYNQLYYNEKLKLREFIQQATFSYLINLSTMNALGLQHAKNILFNTAVNLDTRPITNLKDTMIGASAIVVGAGPSLEKDIELLKMLKSRCVIIAAGSSIQSLQHYGIEPHIVVSMDGGEANYRAFKDIKLQNALFVYNPQIEYRIVEPRNDNYMHAFFTSDSITHYLMGAAHPFHSNFSVTGTAIQVAAYLGCQEIILTGQDLSYPTESMYAAGAQHIELQELEATVGKANELVDNVQGGKNRTNMKMQVTLANIEEEIKRTKNVRFINASRLGARIEHTEFEPMERIWERMSTDDSSIKRIEQALSSKGALYESSKKAEIEDRLKHLPQLINDVESELKKVKRKLNQLLELSRTNPDKCLNSMAAIEDHWGIIVKSKPFEVLYVYVVGADVHKLDRKLPELTEERNIQKKAELFVAVLGPLIDKFSEVNKELLSYIDEAIVRVDRLRTTQ